MKAKVYFSIATILLGGCSLDPENFKSLDFFGKIIDQEGHPVGGVDVTARVGTYEGFDHGGGSDYKAESDSAGKFRFIRIVGAGMGFTLDKKGYEYDQALPSSYRSNDYKPDSNNPVVFKVWKLKGPEPLFHSKVTVGIPCNGEMRTFNLLPGQQDGELEISLIRNPLDIDRKKPFDWNLTIGIKNGGLIEIAGSYPYEAPAVGYEPSMAVKMRSADKNWSSTVSKSYYFVASDRRTYGRVDIYVRVDFQPPPTLFGAEIFTNPSGSRNLEFDAGRLAN